MSVSAALHRLWLLGDGSSWQGWQKWSHAGDAPITVVRYGLAFAVIVIGWIAKSERLKVQSILVGLFLVANVYWDFYALILVPLVLSTLLGQDPTTKGSAGWRYGVTAVYILSVIIGSNYRPWLGPWSQLEPSIIAIAAPDTLRSLGFFMIAAVAATAALSKHRVNTLLLVSGLFLTYNLPAVFMFQLTEYMMLGSLSALGVKSVNAVLTIIPSVMFLYCFGVQCKRERAFEAGWQRRLLSFHAGT
jgi:hypothetical protein